MAQLRPPQCRQHFEAAFALFPQTDIVRQPVFGQRQKRQLTGRQAIRIQPQQMVFVVGDHVELPIQQHQSAGGAQRRRTRQRRNLRHRLGMRRSGFSQHASGPPKQARWTWRKRQAQLTFTALQAAATALCWTDPAPYRSAAALSVAVRAWAKVVPLVM